MLFFSGPRKPRIAKFVPNSGTLIQALRYLGKDQMDDGVMVIRAARFRHDRAGLRKDLIYAPGWIADILRPLTQPNPAV